MDIASLFTEIVHSYLPKLYNILICLKLYIVIYQNCTLLFTDYCTLLFTGYPVGFEKEPLPIFYHLGSYLFNTLREQK